MSRKISSKVLRASATAANKLVRTIFNLDASVRIAARPRVSFLEPRHLLSRVVGIDVSHYQGPINWTSVHNAGKQFTYVKSTEGVGVTDAYLTSNMTNASSAGLLTGVYHRATPATATNDATNEANYFVQVAGQYLTEGYLRPALDLSGNTALNASQLTAWANTFISTVQTATGVEPLIYGNNTNVSTGLTADANVHSLWIARWSSAYGDPTTTGSPPTGVWASPKTWSFWQYSNTGTVSGVSGSVDLNSFNGDSTQLQALVIPPKLKISGAASVDEGSNYTLGLSATNLGQHSVSSWAINWGDGTSLQTVAGNMPSVTHVFAEGPSWVAISATEVDDLGAHAVGNAVTVSVANVAPTLTPPSAATPAEPGEAFSLPAISFSDPGAGESFTANVEWGDGSNVEAATVTPNGTGNGGIVTGTHQYSAFGDYTAIVTVTDSNGAATPTSVPVTISTDNVSSVVYEDETSQRVRVTFNRHDNNVSEQWLVMRNLTTGQILSAANQSFAWDSATVGSFTFSGLLPDGHYIASIGVQETPLAVWQADFNRDGTVDIVDNGILSGHWHQDPATFSEGDANYDGKVDIVDLGMLAGQWHATLSPAATPGDISVSAMSSDSIAASWIPVAGVVGYRLQISSDGETFSFYKNVIGASQFGYVATGLQDGTRYWFRVRAYGNELDTSYTGKKADTTIVDAPTNLALTPLDSGREVLNWTDNSRNETGFRIDAVSTDESIAATVSANPTSTDQYTLPELDESVNWTITVTALGNAQASLGSSTILHPPIAVPKLAARSNSSTSITWPDTYSTASNYVIQRKAGPSEFTTLATLERSSPLLTLHDSLATYIDATVVDGNIYSYRVYASGNTDNSFVSNSSEISIALTSPTRVSAFETGTTTVNIAWTDVSRSENGYLVQRSADNGLHWTTAQIVAANEHQIDDTVDWSFEPLYRIEAFQGTSSTQTAQSVPSEVVSVDRFGPDVSAITVSGSTGQDPYVRQLLNKSADLSITASNTRGTSSLKYVWSIVQLDEAGKAVSDRFDPTTTVASTNTSAHVVFYKASRYKVTAKIIDGEAISTSSVYVDVKPTFSSIRFNYLRVTQLDQFGQVLPDDDHLPISWSLTGDGSLTNQSDSGVDLVFPSDGAGHFADVIATVTPSGGVPKSFHAPTSVPSYGTSQPDYQTLQEPSSGQGGAIYSDIATVAAVGYGGVGAATNARILYDSLGVAALMGADETITTAYSGSNVEVTLPADAKIMELRPFFVSGDGLTDISVFYGGSAIRFTRGGGSDSIPGYDALDWISIYQQEGQVTLNQTDPQASAWRDGSAAYVKVGFVGAAGSSDRVQVGKLNLRAYLTQDINDDGTIGAEEGVSNTAFLYPNIDDDNHNSIDDWKETITGSGEDDLLKVKLTVPPEITGGEIYLSVSNASNQLLRVWNNPGRTGTPVLSEADGLTSVKWAVGSQPSTFYVEGIRKWSIHDTYDWLAVTTHITETSTTSKGHKASIKSSYPSLTAFSVQYNDDIFVDADHDGRIGTAIATPEETSPSHPYTFWINNDDDMGDKEVLRDQSGFEADSSKSIISSQRDLEDWFVVELNSPGYPKDDSTYKTVLGLSAASNGMSIKYRVLTADEVSSAKIGYLSGHSATNFQHESDLVAGHTPLHSLSGGETIDVSSEFSSHEQRLYLLVEGVHEGVGSLELATTHNAIPESKDSLFLNLKSIDTMFEDWTVGDFSAPTDTPPYIASIQSRATLTGDSGPDLTETSNQPDRYILFVHGWNVKPNERRNEAATTFKRLWWQGYQGGFGLYNWPTATLPHNADILSDPSNFDSGEFVGFHAAEGLRALLHRLNTRYDGNVDLFAHSQGNIVASEALREEALSPGHTQLVKVYAATQAAVAASAYAPVPNRTEHIGSERLSGIDAYGYYPDILGGSPYFGMINSVAGVCVNMENPKDEVLNEAWEGSEWLKADTSALNGYMYGGLYGLEPFERRDPDESITKLHFPQNRFEIFAYAAEAFSRAAGRQPALGGVFAGHDVALDTKYGFSDAREDHSGQLSWTLKRSWDYWKDLVNTTFN